MKRLFNYWVGLATGIALAVLAFEMYATHDFMFHQFYPRYVDIAFRIGSILIVMQLIGENVTGAHGIMLNSDETGLEIFESFLVDEKLPKHKAKAERARALVVSGQDDSEGMSMSPTPFRSSRMRVSVGQDMVVRNPLWREPGWFAWMKQFVWKWIGRRVVDSRPVLTVEEFFKSVKNSAQELAIVAHRAAGYEATIKQAEANGQTALLEQLIGGLEAVRAEAQLVGLGLNKHITEEKLVEFVKKSREPGPKKRALRLDWIHRFTRLIPEGVSQSKRLADERECFDNYVVLHYDPKNTGSSMTVVEKAKELARTRDPILFGVMEGSRKLYFIGDWIDEYCDLTLDKIADTLGQNAIGSTA